MHRADHEVMTPRADARGVAPPSPLVSFEHRPLERYGPAAESHRRLLDSSVGWIGVLGHFARHCAAASPLARDELR